MFKWHFYYRKKVYHPEKSTRSKGNENYIENIDYHNPCSFNCYNFITQMQEKFGQALIIECLYVCMLILQNFVVKFIRKMYR